MSFQDYENEHHLFILKHRIVSTKQALAVQKIFLPTIALLKQASGVKG